MKSDDSSNVSNESRVKWSISSATDIGGSRENQDDMFIWENKKEGVCVIGVLDGHGREVGQIAANCAKNTLLNFVDRNYRDLFTRPYEFLVDAIKSAHAGVKEGFISALKSRNLLVEWVEEGYLVKRTNPSSQWSCVHGGSSCSIVAIVGSRLYSANVGDSSAILCSQHSMLYTSALKHLGDSAISSDKEGKSDSTADSLVSKGTEDAPTNTLVITAEHSPENPSEFIRFRNFRPRVNDPLQPSLMVVYDASTHDKSRCNAVFRLDSTGNPVVTNKGR
jgi:serine/threonine protein phosphatase PrpC